MAQSPTATDRVFTAVVHAVTLAVALPCAVTSWLETRLNPSSEGIFLFWAHIFSRLPGFPGDCFRRAYYRLTLKECSLKLRIGFGAFFSHRDSRVEDGVYVGPYAVIGSAYLRRGCLIGTRVSLLSGAAQHELDEAGRWATPDHTATFRQIEIGEHAWIGEAATIMADVGAGSAVAAGAVVSSPVPPGIVVAGNPARFVRKARREP